MSDKPHKKTEEGCQAGKSKRRIEHWKLIALYLMVFDIIAINISWILGLMLRFDFRYSMIPKDYLHAYICFAPAYTAIAVAIFYRLRLYNSLWRFASFSELTRSLLATVITGLIHWIGITVLFQPMPISYYIVGQPVYADNRCALYIPLYKP